MTVYSVLCSGSHKRLDGGCGVGSYGRRGEHHIRSLGGDETGRAAVLSGSHKDAIPILRKHDGSVGACQGPNVLMQ